MQAFNLPNLLRFPAEWFSRVGNVDNCFVPGVPKAMLVCALSMWTGWLSASAKEPSFVAFDAPAIVIAEPLDPAVATGPINGGSLLRLRIPVSTQIQATFRGQIHEFVVEIESPVRALRVIDHWPKTEMYSEVDGTISVQGHTQKEQSYNFKVSGGYEPFARGAASGDYQSQVQIDERYQRRPPMQLLTSSGTIGRGYGVFFKFRPGAVPVLEGDREIAMLVEAPAGWRGDLLHISMRAVGNDGSNFPGRDVCVLGSTQLWTAVHLAGDAQAAQAARRVIASEQVVRRMAAASQSTIDERALPTLFHKVGAALDVVQPRIPADYLNQILFNLNAQYFDSATSRLPVDLRVAALDYWDQRQKWLLMASNY